MKSFSLTLGARNTPSAGHKFLAGDEAAIRNLTAHYFPDGFSILNVKGTWFDSTKNKFVKEEARQIWVCASNRRVVKAWARALANALGQKELLIVELGQALRLKIRSSQ